MYCALVPFTAHVGDPITELQLLFIDGQALTLVDKIWVTDSRSEACATRARLHVHMVGLLTHDLTHTCMHVRTHTHAQKFLCMLHATVSSNM